MFCMLQQFMHKVSLEHNLLYRVVNDVLSRTKTHFAVLADVAGHKTYFINKTTAFI